MSFRTMAGTASSKPARAATARQRAVRGPHAERSDETRAKVINAAIQCIAEYGYKHATVTRIAKRAGVSWGGMQHHFGTKDAIIQAVIDHALDEFVVESRRISPTDDDLETRVKVIVESGWQLLNRPGFLALFEIVLGNRFAPPKANSGVRYRVRVWKVIDSVWQQLFGHLNLSRERDETARRMTFTTLGGMVIESLMSPAAPNFDNSLRVLRQNLLALLRERSRVGPA